MAGIKKITKNKKETFSLKEIKFILSQFVYRFEFEELDKRLKYVEKKLSILSGK